jgi:Uma2 family endonuclease
MGTTTKNRHQARWAELADEPALRDLPYTVETNERGQLILSPHSNRHSKRQKVVSRHLDSLLPSGESYPEFALATPEGVKVPDVVWMSEEREADMAETGDPSTLAPEICVEILSEANTLEEMAEKRALYREIGAEEVWLVMEDGTIRFYAGEEQQTSTLAPDMPATIDQE